MSISCAESVTKQILFANVIRPEKTSPIYTSAPIDIILHISYFIDGIQNLYAILNSLVNAGPGYTYICRNFG